MSHRTKCNFSTTDGDFFTKISVFIAERIFNNPWKFHWNIAIAPRITAFIIFFSVFQNDAEDIALNCNVQCSMSLNSFFSKHVLKNNPTFHTSWMSFCEAHYFCRFSQSLRFGQPAYFSRNFRSMAYLTFYVCGLVLTYQTANRGFEPTSPYLPGKNWRAVCLKVPR